MTLTETILSKQSLDFEDIIHILSLEDKAEQQLVFDKALEVKEKTIGRKVFLRGLIELSNICRKDCYYCGIRKSNDRVTRYSLTHEEALESARFAHDNHFGSIVIQSGELLGKHFVDDLEQLISSIHKNFPELLITLSCGEHDIDVYRRWREAGADRYLLRIESSNPELYHKIHPNDVHHDYDKRLTALDNLRKAGYQVGTGVMIGLPWQSINDLANDLLFFRNIDVDMIGMGPYIEHSETPLYQQRHTLWSYERRFSKSLLMIAALRILMPTINIASSTALETLDPQGRQKGLLAGANVVMPNVTPLAKKVDYKLYEKKAGLYFDSSQSLAHIKDSIEQCGDSLCLDNPGIPRHFTDRISQ